MDAQETVTLGDVRSVVLELAAALQVEGANSAAGILRDAALRRHDGPPEELLELRSALVSTRAEWEIVPDEALLAQARRVLAAAKRLAIEM